MISNAEHPFDDLAQSYDEDFSHTLIGELMRKRVWRWMDQSFQPGDRLLELNCGTGEDAIYLAKRGIEIEATDASAGMIKVVQDKVSAAGLEPLIRTSQLSIENLDQWPSQRLYDGIYSNFGGLNCIQDLGKTAKQLHRLCRPEGRVIVCVMGPVVPWEWFWYVCRGQFAKAFRRLNPGGIQWHDLTIYYPSIGQLNRSFSPYFKLRRKAALGALLPPPYMESFAVKRPNFIKLVNRWEQRLEQMFPLPWLADHYLAEFVRI